MIKSVIFDFDEMVHLEKGFFSDWIVKQYNLSEEALKEFFMNEYKLCRIGKLDTKHALKTYLPKFGWKNGVEEFIQCWIDYGDIDKEMIILVNQLKEKGIKCILCTNNEIYRMNYCIEKHKLDVIFDNILLSAKLGFLKPEKQMLEKILEISKSEKDEILFCDDKDSFIEEANKFGFKTHKYKTIEEFKILLKSLKLI